MILLRGTHELAVANGLADVDRNTRTSLTFREQFADPAAGLALAREGLEIASRIGSASYGFMMVGNAMSCSLRTGDWDWAAALLEEWLSNEITGSFYLELYADRAVLTALRGGDPTADLAEAERLVVGFMGDPSTLRTSIGLGRGSRWPRSARRGAEGGRCLRRADRVLRADLVADRRAGGLVVRRCGTADEAVIASLEGSLTRGQAVALDIATLHAGLAALEGRRAEASAGYREALRGWRQLGLRFDEAMAALDMAILLAPTEREMAEARRPSSRLVRS